jgi:hypothetical protein
MAKEEKLQVRDRTSSQQNIKIYLEVVSKPQIRFKDKAQADRESAVRLRRMSIYWMPVLHLNLKK